MKKKQMLLILLLLFISGCSIYDPSIINIRNSQKIQDIKSWNISYDSSNGYAKSNSLIINEEQYTDYLNPNSTSAPPDPAYEYSEIRGKNISDIIKENLLSKGLQQSEYAEGNIVIGRPTFFDGGRHILHTLINAYDKDKNELARFDIFNNSIQRTTTKGVYYDVAGDVLNDSLYAVSCAGKILKVLNQ